MSLNLNIEATALYEQLMLSRERFTLCFGGAGSSKSYTTGQYLLVKGLQQKSKILVLRKEATTLKDSVMSLFVDELLNKDNQDLAKYFKMNWSNRVLTNYINGTQYLFRGLDDPNKLKSISGITDVWFEEADQFDRYDFEQLNLRLRGKGVKRMYYFTFNPIDESHWLKKRFIDSGIDNVTVIRSTYKDNPFLDDEYIQELERYKEIDYNYYKIYALGEWGKIDSGAELYKGFKVGIHTGFTQYDPDLPLHLSFDENVNPYLACSIWQATGSKAWKVDEVALESPMNSLEYTTTEIKKRYHDHRAGMFIYGDATSWKQDTKIEKGYNFFRLIEEQLSQFHPVLRVPKANPSVLMRTGFIDRYFKGLEPSLNITIGENCKKTIEDFKYVKQAADGTKLKEKKKDPKTLVAYEPYGHFTDTDEYFICEYFRAEYENYLSGGHKEVNYRMGLRALKSQY
jgi:phage terminase large subunit